MDVAAERRASGAHFGGRLAGQRAIGQFSGLRTLYLFNNQPIRCPCAIGRVRNREFPFSRAFSAPLNPGTAAVELFECVFFGWLPLRLVEAPKSLASRALTFGPLIFVGKVSYGIFVFQTLVAVSLSSWLKAAGLNEANYPFLRAAILAAIGIAVAAASWYWMEQPLNRWVRNREFNINTFMEAWKGGHWPDLQKGDVTSERSALP